MASKRIINYPEVQTISEGDYLLMDNNLDGTKKILAKIVGGKRAEIIEITAGDNTISRTFTFSKTPMFIKFYWGDPVITGGWASDAELIWGQDYINYRAKQMGATIGSVDGGINTVSYGADGKSITITGGNAFGAFNTSNGSGLMFVYYGENIA